MTTPLENKLTLYVANHQTTTLVLGVIQTPENNYTTAWKFKDRTGKVEDDPEVQGSYHLQLNNRAANGIPCVNMDTSCNQIKITSSVPGTEVQVLVLLTHSHNVNIVVSSEANEDIPFTLCAIGDMGLENKHVEVLVQALAQKKNIQDALNKPSEQTLTKLGQSLITAGELELMKWAETKTAIFFRWAEQLKLEVIALGIRILSQAR